MNLQKISNPIRNNVFKKTIAIAAATLALGTAAAQAKPNKDTAEKPAQVRFDNKTDNYGRAMVEMSANNTKNKKTSFPATTTNITLNAGNNTKIETTNNTIYTIDKTKTSETSLTTNKKDSYGKTDFDVTAAIKNSNEISDNITNSGSLTFTIGARGQDTTGSFLAFPDNSQILHGDFKPQFTVKGQEKFVINPQEGIQLYSQFNGLGSVGTEVKIQQQNFSQNNTGKSGSSKDGSKTVKKPQQSQQQPKNENPTYGNTYNFSLENGLIFEKIFFKNDNMSISNKNTLSLGFNYKNILADSGLTDLSYDMTSGLKSQLNMKTGSWGDFSLTGSGQYIAANDMNGSLKNSLGLKASFIPFKDNKDFKLFGEGEYSSQKSLTEDNKSSESLSLSGGVNVNKDLKFTAQYKNSDTVNGKREMKSETLALGTDVNLNNNVKLNGKYTINIENPEKNSLTIGAKIKY